MSCFHDVTECSGAYEEIKRHREELSDIFENSPVGIHVVDGNGIVVRANRAELELLGYSADEFIGRHIAEFHVDEPVIKDILERLSQGEELEKYPARMRAKDGSVRHVAITSNALIEDGKLIRTRCFTVDVTAANLAEEREQEGHRHCQAVLDAMPVAIFTTDAEGRITFFNDACIKLVGRKPEIGVDRWCIAWRLYTLDGEPLAHEQCPMAVALKERRAVSADELILERPDGGRSRVLPYPTPLFDSHGRLTGAVNMLVDVTAQHEIDVQLARLAAIVASSDDAIIGKSLDGRIMTWNAGASRVYGYEEHEVIGKPITIIIPPELHQEESEILAKLRVGERVEHYETVRVTKDGRRIDVSITVSPIRDRLGRVVGASKVSRDITGRKRNEEIQQLLVRELNHRVKNTLAMVQSIASQTIRSAKSPGGFMASFQGRLQALARTHGILTNTSWQGAAIGDLIRDQLLLGDHPDDRISLNGPNVVLNPQAALHLALVLHELGTNAHKYGALSVTQGHLELQWAVRDHAAATLLLEWKERGGPPVEAPSRRGFGSTLIERSLDAQGGEVVLSFPQEGVVCEIKLPLEVGSPAASNSRMPPAAHRDSGRPSSAGPAKTRILVVEDEPLVGMDIALVLSEAGCEVIGPAVSIEEARSLIATSEVDAALLDANLGGQPVDDLAAELKRRTPFAFLTGYGREGMPQAFRDVPLIDKPFTPDQLMSVLGLLIDPRAAA